MGHLVIPSSKPFSLPSFVVYGNSTAPAALTTIAIKTLLQDTRWHVQIKRYFSAGAPAAGDADNIQLLHNATVISRLIMPPVLNLPIGSDGEFFAVDCSVGDSISVQAIGAGTAGVTYVVQLILTRFNS